MHSCVAACLSHCAVSELILRHQFLCYFSCVHILCIPFDHIPCAIQEVPNEDAAIAAMSLYILVTLVSVGVVLYCIVCGSEGGVPQWGTLSQHNLTTPSSRVACCPTATLCVCDKHDYNTTLSHWGIAHGVGMSSFLCSSLPITSCTIADIPVTKTISLLAEGTPCPAVIFNNATQQQIQINLGFGHIHG